MMIGKSYIAPTQSIANACLLDISGDPKVFFNRDIEGDASFDKLLSIHELK
jgi:hypothetical protein